MRRLLAVLALSSMAIAQVSTLACPSAHHSASDRPEPHAPDHSTHAPARTSPHESADADAPRSHHGAAGECVMMLTCTAIAETRAAQVITAELDLHDLGTRVPERAYTNPPRTAPTPPPKLA